MTDLSLWILPAFFTVALVYSSVGFAGGSSYLLVLTLAGIAPAQAKPIALFCNLIVSSCALWHFSRGGHLEIKKILPFILASVPTAYLGAKAPLPKEIFYALLGFALLVASMRLLISGKTVDKVRELSPKSFWVTGLSIGGGLGFISGFLGIGGGIFLHPFLLLSRLADSRKAAAAASFFILVNSLSGFFGQGSNIRVLAHPSFIFLAVTVFIGGQIGSMLGAYRLPRLGLQRVVATLILYIAFQMIGKAF